MLNRRVESFNIVRRYSTSGIKTNSSQQSNNQPLPQGCSVKPIPKTTECNSPANTTEKGGGSETSLDRDASQSGGTQAMTSENDEATALMTASFHSRTCSLPRQKRLGREDGSPGPSCVNVAVVSPMPTTKSSKGPKQAKNTVEQSKESQSQSKDKSKGNPLSQYEFSSNLKSYL